MAYIGVLTFTGEGSYDFGSAVDLIFLNWVIRSFGNVQLLSTASPQRVMHAGWLALGYDGGVFTSAPPSIQWFKYIEFESESYVFNIRLNGNVNCDHLYYHLETGVSLDVFLQTS